MARAKIAITVDEQASAAIEEAVHEYAKLDKREEQALAEEGYVGESEWPEY